MPVCRVEDADEQLARRAFVGQSADPLTLASRWSAARRT
jgi:hypothetical protein